METRCCNTTPPYTLEHERGGRVFLDILSENFRTKSKLSADITVLLRWQSSPKDMSSIQCREFSTAQ